MECKDVLPVSEVHIISVLIETLWNVKIETVLNTLHQAVVLIETLWNVKMARR